MSIFYEKMNNFKSELKHAYFEFKNSDTRHKQVPNILTLSRLLSPLIIIPSALSGNFLLAGVFAGIFGLTDTFDGKIARKYNCQSNLGATLDAITDKVFAISLVIPLISIFPAFVSVVGLEVLISTINAISNIGGNKIKTKNIGRVKTVSLFTSVAAAYTALTLSLPFEVVYGLIGSSVILQVASATTYANDLIKNNNMKFKDELIEDVAEETSLENEKSELEELKELRQNLINDLSYEEVQNEKGKSYYIKK